MASEIKEREEDIAPEVGWIRRIPTAATIRSAVREVTVEPAVFLTSIAVVMQSVVIQQLVKERSCRVSYNHTEEYCLNVTDAVFSRHLEVVIADYNLYTRILVIGPYIFFALFLGSFCDRHGSKLVIMGPLFGDLISSSILALVSYTTTMAPEVTLIAHAVKGLTGSHAATYLGVDNYIMKTSTHKTRTARLALLEVAFLAGTPLGYLLGGQLYGTHNYTTVFLVSLVFYVLTIAYLGVRLRKEPFLRTSPRRALSDAFSLADLRSGVMIVCRPRSGRNRIYVILSVICARLVLFPLQGEHTMFFPYAQLKFNFTVKEFSNYDAFTTGIICIGTLTVLPLLSFVLKIKDVILGLAYVFLNSASHLTIALSNTYKGLYVASGLQLGFTGSYVICRSLMSKCVDQNEQGKLNAFHGLLGAGVPILAGVVYTELFHATVATYPAACFLLSTAMNIIPAAILFWMLLDMRNNRMQDISIGDNVELIETELDNTEQQHTQAANEDTDNVNRQ